ncbi:hypothetical protein [Nostoc flagelliforme]|uniref:hypothetical protein n=1 Tax=Nostoc flagelliforme TaxID=1306274 RepID=UPI000C2CFB50|nr:hypothetical protein [Nostoc flagelliforme]
MNTKQLILKSAIGFFAFSTILSSCVMVFGQKETNHFNITIPASTARLALSFSMMGTAITMFLANRIEAAQERRITKTKTCASSVPRLQAFPRGCLQRCASQLRCSSRRLAR